VLRLLVYLFMHVTGTWKRRMFVYHCPTASSCQWF